MTLRFTDDVATDEAATTEAAVSAMASQADTILTDQYNLALGDLAVLVTGDVDARVDELVASMHLPAGQAGLTSAVGTVSGKTLVDHEQRPVAVVALRAPAWVSYHRTLMTVGHELAHVIERTVEAAIGPAAVDPRTPAEWDRLTGLSVAAEYRAEQTGARLCADAFTATDTATGQPLDLWAERRRELAADLDPYLDQLVPAIPDAIASIRTSWNQATWDGAVALLSGVIVYLGYLVGSNETGSSLIAASTKRGADLLRPLWEPMFNHLDQAPGVPPVGIWEDDRGDIQWIAEVGIDEVYRSLGVIRKPTASGSYTLAFRDPTWKP